MSNKVANKKQKLLARKKELLNELKYYERRIEEEQSGSVNSCDDDADCSNSEIEFNLDTGPSLGELKKLTAQCKTCLLALQELTELAVLQSEVNTLVDPPSYINEAPITEEGTWKEVMAECRIDLVLFTISFYTYQPSRLFAATTYRELSVMPTKQSQEKELQLSVLPTLAAPSDALEVLRNYAVEYRARRKTLSQLADKYGDCLFIEKSQEGGFTVRCADLLRISWTLQNKSSPVACFRHKMKFDLEYMDEPYVKAISQAYKALGDPALDTDGRTLLLIQIIDKCLEAKRLMGPTVDPLPSDQDSDVPTNSHQIMGPPRSLPKKKKREDKENVATNDMRLEINTIGESSEVKTKAGVDEYKPQAKKCKMSVANINKKTELANSNTKQNTDKKKEPKSKDNIVKETVVNEINENQKSGENKNLHSKPVAKNLKDKAGVHENEPQAKNSKMSVANINKKTELADSNTKQNTDKKKEPKTKDNIVKETVVNEINENQKSGENKNLHSKPVAKNLNAKAGVHENEPPAKKCKMSVANIDKKIEHTDSNTKQNTDKNKPNNKDNIVKETLVTEKNVKQMQNQDKNIQSKAATKTDNVKKIKNNLIPEKSQQNPKCVKNVVKKTENNQVLKLNTKESLKKTSITDSKPNIVQKSNNLPTLSERFKNKMICYIDNNTNEVRMNKELKNANLIKTTEKSNKFKINKLDKNALKSKLNSKNKLNQKPDLENQNTVKLNSKLNLNNNQKARKSPRLKISGISVFSGNVVANKIASKIPQKNIIVKNLVSNTQRISPRSHQIRASTTHDSSKTSAVSQHKQTHIPRLLKKPRTEPN